MDMFVHFRDNQENEFDVKSYSDVWTNKNNYTMYKWKLWCIMWIMFTKLSKKFNIK